MTLEISVYCVQDVQYKAWFLMEHMLADFRGFGFVTFCDGSSVEKVLGQGSHYLDGKKVRLQLLGKRATDFGKA